MSAADYELTARRNLQAFTFFRMFFSARFYYPVFALLFLDFGLSLEQFGILNAVWAATIVLCEVPSGALADTIGRRNLLITTGLCMFVEMGVLLLAPINGGAWLFSLFLINRVVSGFAEAAASGADEALAYDSLKAAGKEDQWGRVLERVQRDTSIAFFFSMMVGAAVYDPVWVNKFLNAVGVGFYVGQKAIVKLPILLTFFSSWVVLFMAFRMKEPSRESTLNWSSTIAESWRRTVRAGRWIWCTPLPFGILLAAVVLDSPIRLFLTLASGYWESIQLPVASFGLVGSGMALLGLAVPFLARRMSERYKPVWNFSFLCALVLVGLVGLGFVIPYWGILPAVCLFAALHFMNFFVSRYLNAEADSDQRATVLSFKGLSTNVTYGAISLLYSVLVAGIREGTPEDTMVASTRGLETPVFVTSLQWLPVIFIVGLFAAIVLYSLKFWNKNKRSSDSRK
ncbi:MAG: MFS transporter [Coraliomargaritaceae bacterium]